MDLFVVCLEYREPSSKVKRFRRVYIRHLENTITGINNSLHDFNVENEQHFMEIKTLKVNFSNKIQHKKLLDDQILALSETEESEKELDEIITRDIREIIAGHVL